MLRITLNPRLKERTTLRLGGTALAEVVVTSVEDCRTLTEAVESFGGTPFVLGAGSNLLAHDGELPVVLLRCGIKSAPEVLGEGDDGAVLLRVGGGVPMPRLLTRCAKLGLSGLEGLSGIPGSVGGAVAMNAGSFGGSVGPLLRSITIYSNKLGVVDVPAADIEYGYRSLRLKRHAASFLLLYATFGLTRAATHGITEQMRQNFLKKKSTQPLRAWSAGCTFKNPSVEQPAGMLLEQAGFKGKTLGGMAFSTLHANFMVNTGTGTAAAALDLMAMAQEVVLERFGVRLEPEVRILSGRAS